MTLLFEKGRCKMPCYLTPTPNLACSRYETPPFERYQQTFGRGQPSGHRVRNWSPGVLSPSQLHPQLERKLSTRRSSFWHSRSNSQPRGGIATPGLPSSVPQPHRELWDIHNLVRSAVALGDCGHRLPILSFRYFGLRFGRTHTDQRPEVLKIASDGASASTPSEH